ncbi:hypothetical protein D918_09934 [Trichuris suis]|nr:hypothetical protein D918_09934 [Trichuris suis]
MWLVKSRNSLCQEKGEQHDVSMGRTQSGCLLDHLREIAAAVKAQHPAHGKWDVSGNKAKIWVDTSVVALGVALEVNGAITEDGAWLRPDDA